MMRVGALDARRWAGLVFAAGPGDGVGLRLIFTTPDGERRDLEDWYWMVSRVGPHAPDGCYARMEFDLAAEPSPASRPVEGTLILEWSRREGAVALRAVAGVPGRVELVADDPWGWKTRWEEGPDGWRAGLGSTEIAAAFAPRARERVAAVVAWEPRSAPGPRSRPGASLDRAQQLLPELDRWIDDARTDWDRRRPRGSGAAEGLVEAVTDNLMWTVLLQPETGRLYAPAGRRWIFPKPRDETPTESTPNPDDWTVFGWDSFFNALALATASGRLAWDALLAGLESRYPNGNVPNWRSRLGGTPDRSQPPVGSFAALKLHLACPDADALAAAWPGLRAWNDWWVADKGGRPRREGLTRGLFAWGSDTALVPERGRLPEWEVGASGHQRAAWESGQDDLPLWDDVEWDPGREVLAMSAVDLCSYRALDLECLSRIARIFGDPAEAARLDDERRRIVAAMNRVLWSDAAGLYLDELPGSHSTRVAASNFLPLIAGVPSARQARRMVDVLRDPARFRGEWVLPTISRDDPAFDDQQYWRGSIWPPMNYLVLQGLRRYGFDEFASELAWKGALMFLADRRRTGFCRENFDARSGRGRGRRFQSWGPLFALGAIEEFVDTCPWRGLRTGSRLPAFVARGDAAVDGAVRARVEGLRIAGEARTVELSR
ncbi:trehalase family glycosidase [Candidatus Palauibacter polyketidifaciens]|uniref:MGH1-like glycoside hydrolase domain-containing protein n=1 Tax=Candidatus Palauibacter polyketidifaciens TaxID=3056740 RepID=UPI0023A46BE0|nr:trehalase family glycosidase [Candidatus Palauibacter polyketidifaciens]MDE2720362.1 trehalase family glycosidase [Candidatus Palauibacter polyketidifaciens]